MSFCIFNQQRNRAEGTQNTATSPSRKTVSGNGRTTPTDRQTLNQTTPTDTEKIKSPPHRNFFADTHLAHWQVAPSPPTTQTWQRAKFSNRTRL